MVLKMKKFYRTYVVCFRTSSGLKYYAGKHVSKYENTADDPYRGSGRVITRTVKKYGLTCIESIEWADHTKETLNDAEIALIDECKEKYGVACVNIAKGGDGGNLMEYATEEEKSNYSMTMKESLSNPEVKAKRIAALKSSLADPEVKAKRSVAQKKTWTDPEVKVKRIAAFKLSWADPESKAKRVAAQREAHDRPEVKAKRSAAKRTSPVWHGELYQQLWKLWLELDMPKCGKFEGYCKKNDVTDLSLSHLVKHFNERYQNEQLQEAA